MAAMSSATEAKIAIIGAGPVGVGMAERLTANAPLLAPRRSIEIVLVDPCPPGPGRVWREEQSPLMRMNSFARDVTLFPGKAVRCEGPARPGPSLAAWARDTAAGLLPPVAPRLERDLRETAPDSFATRRLQGAYLSWFLREVTRRTPPGVRVTTRTGRAVALTTGPDGVQRVRLEHGGRLDADAVVLALGHLDARPRGEEADAASFAAEYGLAYLPPGLVAEADLSVLPPGSDVLVRGMGLAFFDTMALLTQGRGGRYTRDAAGTLRYVPSGREPRLLVGSRRGLPYRCKPTRAPVLGPVRELRHLPGTVERLLARGRTIDFRRDIWPVVVKDLSHAYYRELFAARPDSTTMPWWQFEQLHATACPQELDELVLKAVPDPADRFDLDDLRAPLRDAAFRSADAARRHIGAMLEHELRRARDPARSADTAVYGALLLLYDRLPRLRPHLDARSQAEELDGAWLSLFHLVASGPPAFRVEELLALCRAGVVQPLGAGVRVRLDATAGRFLAGGANLPDEHPATALVDARVPDPTVTDTADPLLASLYAAGEASEEVLTDPGTGYRARTGRIAVDERGRLRRAVGTTHPARYALGWNTSLRGARAFAIPGTDAATFRHGDRVAREVLSGLPRPGRGHRVFGPTD
ncbi:FAD/NAD(P)-binding protein [Streptomyces sp. TRM68416]|uniref:FAD/NAD(P)-binding protein n=1 Tax=Streptomyces sp. TRM68416 TaxID=2758412 RepID=UPI001661F451|nr:FAD/NAD(P)-binding protein [Streptomyces sp. TRM68416]MBD0841740.1 FAD/NAD(P)-binding protein [Streptomyces sp. TRM68416]